MGVSLMVGYHKSANADTPSPASAWLAVPEVISFRHKKARMKRAF